MVYWITGRASSGKTVYSKRLKEHFEKLGEKVLLLDGDNIRQYFSAGFSDEERKEHILRIAKIAAIAESQGILVIVALVSPKKEWRMTARKMLYKSMLIYMPGGTLWEGTDYEEPDHEEMMCGG